MSWWELDQEIRDMFESHYGGDAQNRWMWENLGRPGTWEEWLRGDTGYDPGDGDDDDDDRDDDDDDEKKEEEERKEEEEEERIKKLVKPGMTQSAGNQRKVHEDNLKLEYEKLRGLDDRQLRQLGFDRKELRSLDDYREAQQKFQYEELRKLDDYRLKQLGFDRRELDSLDDFRKRQFQFDREELRRLDDFRHKQLGFQEDELDSLDDQRKRQFQFDREELRQQRSQFGKTRRQEQGQFEDTLRQNKYQFKKTLGQEEDQFDATLAFKMKELRTERDRVKIERGEAAAQKWYWEQQVRLADQTHSLEMGKVGLDYIKTDVELRSTPGSWAQLADFEAGANARQDVPIFLQNLAAGVQGSPYGPMSATPVSGSMQQVYGALGSSMGSSAMPGPSTTTSSPSDPGGGGTVQLAAASGPAPVSSSAVGDRGRSGRSNGPREGNRNGGGNQGGGGPEVVPGSPVIGIPTPVGPAPIPGTEGWSAQNIAMLRSIQDRVMAGPQKMALGAWEMLPTDQKDMFLGGVARLGASPRSWQEGIARWRPGQGSSRLA